MISMNRPSRGLVPSATTIRKLGAFLRPVRRRRMRTAMGHFSCEACCGALGSSRIRRFRNAPSGTSTAAHGRLSALLPHSHHAGREPAPTGRSLLHHLLHVAELLEEAI